MNTITIIPIATGDSITAAAMDEFKTAKAAFAQTTEHCFMRGLMQMRPDCITMDDVYKTALDFDELNNTIADRLAVALVSGNVAYAVLGEVGFGLYSALLEKQLKVRLLPSAGLARAAVDAATANRLIPPYSGLTAYPANSLDVNSANCLLVVTELNSRLTAGEVKLKLTEYYPDDYSVVLAAPSGACYTTQAIPLYMLDRQKSYDAATVLIIPPATEAKLQRHSADGLISIMRRLRAPGGCPWDAEQTHESLRRNLIEESYEVIDAIDRNDTDGICEELGDLLLQIAFHAVIEEERESFSFRDISTGIVNKLIYRHPHVFGEMQVNSSDEVLVNWELLKKKEKRQATVADAMDAVPKVFPALLRAYKIQKKAADVGFDWDNALSALAKVYEEAGEVKAAVALADKAAIEDEVGDLFFAAVNVARLAKLDPELCLSGATAKFEKRFKLTESLILRDGKCFSDMTLAEMDEYWDRAKVILKQSDSK